MSICQEIATALRAVYFGKNWTAVNLKDQLADVTWEEAITKIHDCNTIATLVHHMTYYVRGVKQVLDGGPLEIKDKFSFNHPKIASEEDWQAMLQLVWADVEVFAEAIERLPEETLWEEFANLNYGHYYRNLQGIVEHAHYHLGQIVLLKKMMRAR
jgi:hypothetical protein